MIQREWQKVSIGKPGWHSIVPFLNTYDEYGQKRTDNPTVVGVDMVVKPYLNTNVSDVRFVDVELIGLTKAPVEVGNTVTIGTDEYNVLYDTYEVKVTREDGSVLTSYEACRYTDLKIPADGILTAGYGSLQGFNFGYNHGFSYAQSFSGWTDAAEMEADLRHVRDGYHLAD